MNPLTRNIKELVAENIEGAIVKFAAADDVCWDLTYIMMQGQGGAPMLQGFIVMTMPNPMLDQPSLSAIVPTDALKLRDAETAENAVLGNITALRELKARVLAPTNGGGTGGLIVPGQ